VCNSRVGHRLSRVNSVSRDLPFKQSDVRVIRDTRDQFARQACDSDAPALYVGEQSASLWSGPNSESQLAGG